MGARGCHAIGTSIFVQFCGTLWRYQCIIFVQILQSIEDSAIEGGGDCNTPVLTPFTLNVCDVYIVMNRGVGLKAKSPPSIWLCYVSAIRIVAGSISGYTTHINFGIM